MHIKELKLKNIGPFKEANIDFIQGDDNGELPIILLTGENGTGKSVILDAIRTLFMSVRGIERDVIADHKDFFLSMTIKDNDKDVELSATQDDLIKENKINVVNSYTDYFEEFGGSTKKSSWIVYYWDTDTLGDKYNIEHLYKIDCTKSLNHALKKGKPNIDITQFITTIDYLKGSDSPEERSKGEFVFNAIVKLIDSCLDHGNFLHVSRTEFSPKIKILGNEVTLEKLSTGNITLLKHLLRLLSEAYRVCMRNEWPIEEMFNVPGILLIDEIENHLHPKWQKKILTILRKNFPKLQIIATTHSPFVINSMENPKIFVCQSKIDHSEIVEATGNYYGLPVDEILVDTPFEVMPFNDRITDILSKRKAAIRNGEMEEVRILEEELIALNEDYFSVLHN